MARSKGQMAGGYAARKTATKKAPGRTTRRVATPTEPSVLVMEVPLAKGLRTIVEAKMTPRKADPGFGSGSAALVTGADVAKAQQMMEGGPKTKGSPPTAPIEVIQVGGASQRVRVHGGGEETVITRVFKGLLSRDEPLSDEQTRRVIAALDDVLPDPNTPSAEAKIGPVYSTKGLTRRTGKTRQSLNGRVSRHTLLGIPSDDGASVFPAFQFTNPDDPKSPVLPAVKDVIDTLSAAAASPMTIALWFTGEDDMLDGQAAHDWLRSGGDTRQVIASARNDAERWRQ